MQLFLHITAIPAPYIHSHLHYWPCDSILLLLYYFYTTDSIKFPDFTTLPT